MKTSFPIQLTLKTYRSIFLQKYFPNKKQADLDKAYLNLKLAVKPYCSKKGLLCGENEGIQHFNNENNIYSTNKQTIECPYPNCFFIFSIADYFGKFV